MRRGGARVVAIALLAAIGVFTAALAVLDRATRGPAGPDSSSYATAPDGVAAYADLLVRRGHPVERIREPLADAELDSAATLVLLDPGPLSGADAAALARFVEAGGRLLAGGASPGRWLAELLEKPPVWAPDGPREARPLVPVAALRGVRSVEGAGLGVWEDAGDALPVLAGDREVVAAVAARERGRMILLADTSPLRNRYLGRADNAAFGLAAAGEAGRPVHFVESVHGFGRATGLGAVPARWRWALGGLALAALLLMWARGRRLGPPEAATRDLPPPRRAYVEALAALLGKTRSPGEAAHPLQAEARARLARRAGLPPDAGDEAVREAGRRAGLAAGELDAVLEPVRSREELVAAGRALARLEPGRPR